MGFKLFKSNEDKMVEGMLYGLTPEGPAVMTAIEDLFSGISADLRMIQYQQNAYSTPPLNELILLKAGLTLQGVGVVYYEDAGIFFISRSKILPIHDPLRTALGKMDEQTLRFLAWRVLVKLAWEHGIPMAGIKYFREGFEATIFVKDKKPKKVFLETKEPL
jgi:hypothetical protein